MSTDVTRISARPASAIERRILAFLGALALEFLLLALGVAAAGLARGSILRTAFPQQPLLVLSVALIFAHCNLGAIWWVRSHWPPHAKTTVTVFVLACLWLLLAQLLQTTRDSGPAALAWAVCISLQAALTGIAATILELSISYHSAAARSRFSLQYVFVWMTLLALALGGAGAVVNRFGFMLADVAKWEYFAQLLGVAVAGALLAIAVYTSVRVPPTRLVRGLTCAVVAAIGTILAPVFLLAVFGNNIGAPLPDLIWLFGGESVFLLATLLAFQAAD